MNIRYASLTVALGLYAQLVCPSVSRADAEHEQRLARLRQTYEKHITQIEETHATRAETWPKDYIKELQTLQTGMQKEGNFEGWQTVKQEIERFENDWGITDEDRVDKFPRLAKLQSRYQDEDTRCSLKKGKAVQELVTDYTKHLTAMEKKLTIAGQMEDALSVHEEIQRVRSSSAVTAAEFALGLGSGGPTIAKRDPSPGIATSPPQGSSEVKARDEREECKLQPGTSNPENGGVPMKRQALRNTGLGALKRSVTADVYTGTLSNVDKSKYSSSWSSRRTESGTVQHHSRVTVRTTSRTESISNPTVVIQYFVKNRAAGNSPPELAAVEHVGLTGLDFEGVTIDCPPIETYEYSYKYVSSYGSHSSREEGKDFYGIIVSVFGPDKELMFQGATVQNLKKLASRTMRAEKTQEPVDTRDRVYIVD